MNCGHLDHLQLRDMKLSRALLQHCRQHRIGRVAVQHRPRPPQVERLAKHRKTLSGDTECCIVASMLVEWLCNITPALRMSEVAIAPVGRRCPYSCNRLHCRSAFRRGSAAMVKVALTAWNRGAHSVSFGALYGAGRAVGASLTLPVASSTNMSLGCMRSFGTPAHAAKIACRSRHVCRHNRVANNTTDGHVPPPGRRRLGTTAS